MPVTDGVELLEYAAEQEQDAKLFSRWVVWAQHEMSFDEFKRKLMPPKFKRDKDLLEDTRKIMEGMYGNF